jgi:NTP pyrophosphatase (non-canonical NTP hydrolase)
MTQNDNTNFSAIPANLLPIINHPKSNSFVTVPAPDGTCSITIRYDVMVALLAKQETFRAMVDHFRGGVCEESGELSSVLKKHVVYGQPLTTVMKEDGQTMLTHIIEEIGDVRFFLQALMNMFGISEQAILQHNANKLSKRYSQLAYSDTAANTRLDKATGAVGTSLTNPKD